ncbi:MAG: hypothetical protein JO345_27485, partial [Streptosporangiaceae bacterium]|nr:hypothetical protein [Streptosporangiaceae bacterium]
GNGMIAGRELPPVAVLRMDRLLTARARQFKRAGVDGDMDTLRVLAFLERFGEADPLGDLVRGGGNAGDDGERGGGGSGRGPGPSGPGGPGSGGPGQDGPGSGGGVGGARGCGGAESGGGIAARVHLTAPVSTLTELAGRPGVLRGTGPIDPDLVRDLASQAAKNQATVFDFTLTDQVGRPVAHACGRPGPEDQSRRKGKHTPEHGPPRLTLVDRGPPGSRGTWRYTHGGREIIFEFEDLAGPCDHKHRASGHDPGKHLRHLTAVLNETCTHPACRRPGFQCDYEHSRPYDLGGITCLCEAGPVCRRDHQDKQRPGWKVEGTGARGWFRWKTPSGREYVRGPTIYPT